MSELDVAQALEELTNEIRAFHPEAPVFSYWIRVPGALVAGRITFSELRLGDAPMGISVTAYAIDERRVRFTFKTPDGITGRDITIRLFE
ncbi:MAG: hypothetical protein ABSF84_02845 [Acidimicrobiales bacterium]